MPNILLYRKKALSNGWQESTFWSTDGRTTYRTGFFVDENNEELETYDYPLGALVDSWCEATTRHEVYYINQGYVDDRKTYNSPSCALPPCGIKIDRVTVTGTEQSGPNATATVYTSGYTGSIEYSLNNFVDVQASNVFTGLSIGSYTAYARPTGNGGCVASYPFEVKPDWSVRWLVEYKTESGKQARVEIEDRSWTGATEALRGGASPVSLEYPPIGNKYDCLSGSGLTLEILVEREGLLNDLYTADERKFRVSLYTDNTLEWRGFLLPEWYEEPWVAVGSKPTVRLVASDGIAALRDVYYVVENGLRHYGRAAQLQVLFNCLDKLDLDLPFYTAVNLWETRMDPNTDPLLQAYVEQSGYYDGTTPLGCGEVLERILNPYLCFVRQEGGALHVIPHQARKDAYIRRKYDSKGTFILEEPFERIDTILRNGAVSYREASQVVGIRPQITLGKVTLDYGQMKSFVENGSFEDWAGANPVGWSGDAQVERVLTEEGDSFRLHLSDTFTGDSIASSITDYRGLGRGVTLSFDYEVYYNPKITDCHLWAMVEIGGKWVTKAADGSLRVTDTQDMFTAVLLPYDASAPGEYITEKGTYTAHIFSVPDAGTVQVRLYQPKRYNGPGGPLHAYIDNVRIEPYVEQHIKRMVVEGTNPGYNTVKPFEHTLRHGSGIPQSEALITLADFSPTDLWGEGYLLQEHTLREVLAQHERPTRVLRATLTGASPMGVVRDLHMPSARFGIDGYTLDHRTGRAQVEALELFGGPEELPPTDAIYTEDFRPIHTEIYTYIVKE
jgi:hypothetical protein